MADPSAIQKALTVLKSSKRPLVIIGKGVYIARTKEHKSKWKTKRSRPADYSNLEIYSTNISNNKLNQLIRDRQVKIASFEYCQIIEVCII